MARPRTAVTPARTLADLRASFARVQVQGERMVGRLRRDAEGFMTRSRGEVVKEVREIERRLLKALHGATRERVGRLEHRIAKLEQEIAELRPGGEKAA
jgi:BMFP domain-containing protein YqiC